MKSSITALAAATCLLVLAGLTMAAQPAHATTIATNITLSGTATQNNSGFEGVTSSSFADFNTSLGTLTGVTLSLSGTATAAGTQGFNTDEANSVSAASDVNLDLFSANGLGIGNGKFSFTASGTDSSAADLALFEGSGTQSLVFDFTADEGTLSATGSGTLTYTYTPAVSVPEPDSLRVFAAGLLGLIGLSRLRRSHRPG